jgi:hypothetical protein
VVVEVALLTAVAAVLADYWRVQQLLIPDHPMQL